MASNQTPVYGLNQWSLEDGIIMAEFNADNQKTEQALVAASASIAALQQEAAILRADRTALEAAISAAKTEAKSGDNTLQKAINTAKAEAKSGDNALQAAIDAAKAEAKSGDSTLQDDIDAARAEAKSGDNTLQAAIDAAKAEAKAGDNALQTAINAAKAEAKSGDNTLQAAIDAAKAEAKSGDTALQTAINTAKSEAKSGDSTLQQALNAAKATIPNIAIGAYVGTGTGGESAPTSLTFSFEPKLLIVTVDFPSSILQNGSSVANKFSLSPMVAVRGAAGTTFWYTTGSSSPSVYLNSLQWSGKTVSWWHKSGGSTGNAYLQLNDKDITYRYFAIG